MIFNECSKILYVEMSYTFGYNQFFNTWKNFSYQLHIPIKNYFHLFPLQNTQTQNTQAQNNQSPKIQKAKMPKV